VNIIVVGGGRLGYFVCRSFVDKGHHVTLINRDEAECARIARRLTATVVLGDGGDPQILADAGAPIADVMVAITNNDEDNLVICQLAGLQFGVLQTVALVTDPDHEEVFRNLGVTAVSTTRILSGLIEQMVAFEEIMELMPVGEGKVNVTNVVLSEKSPIIGIQLSDVPLPKDSLIACVLRAGQPIVPTGTTVLRREDRVIAISLPENHNQVLKTLTGHAGE
jgi:trk system potassium uptake protein